MRSNRPDISGLAVKILRNFVLILFLVLFISIVYNFRNKETDTVSAVIAEATASNAFKGVFLRDEKVITYSGNGILSYNVSDGGKLGNGTVIAEVYPNDEQLSINRDIRRLNRKLEILNKIQNPGTLESAQPASLSANIDETFRNLIYCRDVKDYDGVMSDMDTLLVQMSTYQIITNEVSSFTQQINDITAELEELKNNSVAPTETIVSDHSSYFASYIDGYEDKLTKDSADSITIQQINEITDRKISQDNVVGKVIDGYSWCLAGVIDNSRKEYAIGDYVRLRFESSAETFTAEITDIRDSEDPKQSVFILSCSQFNYELVQHRAENVEIIRGTFRGLKVPREAIRFRDITEEEEDEEGNITYVTVNYKGVYILKGEQIEFKKIDVNYEGTDYVLSVEHSGDSSYLSLYDDIMIEGVENGGN